MNDPILIPIRRSTRARLSALAFLLTKTDSEVIDAAIVKMIQSMPKNKQTATIQIAERLLVTRRGFKASEDTNQRLADEIRDFVNATYVKPARETGKQTITITIKTVHQQMKLTQRYAAVKSALLGKTLHRLCNVSVLPSSTTKDIVFKIHP